MLCVGNSSTSTRLRVARLTCLPAISPSRFVLCCLFWLVLLVCFFFGLVLFFGFCFVTELWRILDYIGPSPVYFYGHISRRPSLRQLINSLISATCNRTCWTTWRKPRGVGRKKSPMHKNIFRVAAIASTRAEEPWLKSFATIQGCNHFDWIKRSNPMWMKVHSTFP